jgi:hypothetical protein
MEKYFFVKLLIVLCLVCMILLVGKKINENFDSLNPPPVRLSVDTNKRKNKLNIKWTKNRDDIIEYFLIIFINNDGPYVVTLPHLDVANQDNETFSYDLNDISMNVEYKFAILAFNGRGLSNIDKFVKAKLTPPGLQVEYINDAVSKIICNSDGSHTVTNAKKCAGEPDIVEAKSISYTQKGEINESSFNHDAHKELMRNLKNEPKINLNFL